MASNEPPPLPEGPPPHEHPYKTQGQKARSNPMSSVQEIPRRLLSSYSNFVGDNSSQVSQFESTLRSLIYVIPGRYHETPITAEACHTALSLLSSFHSSILAPSIGEPGYRPAPQLRYEHWAKAKSAMYSRALNLLRTIQYTQLLLEMFAKRAGEKVRWRVVVLLEVVKAICRLMMLRVTGKRWTVGADVGGEIQERRKESPEAENEEFAQLQDEHSKLPNGEPNGSQQAESSSSASRRSQYTSTGEWIMPRTGLNLPPLPSTSPSTIPFDPSSPSPSALPTSSSVSSFLESRVLQPDDIREPSTLVHKLSSLQGIAGESLWILRPLVYALLLQHLQSRSSSTGTSARDIRRDWRPWATGVAMEILSQHLAKADIEQHVVGGQRALSSVDREEMKRRSAGLAWWGMRGAFYERITGPLVKGFAGKVRKLPLVGEMVGTVVEDYDLLWGEYFYSTSTM